MDSFRVLMGLGYYEGGGFTSVVNGLIKHLKGQGVEVAVAARVVRVKPLSWLNLARLTPREFAKEASKYDVVHIHLSYPYLKAMLKANYGRLVVTHHGYAPWHIVPGFKNKMVHLYLRFAYKPLLSKVPCIVVVSNYVKEQLKRMYGLELETKIIYNGVDADIFRPVKVNDKSGYPIVFNATAWNKFKGADLLIKSFRVIHECYPKAVLICCTLPQFSRLAKRLIKKAGLKLGKDVVVLPCKPQERLPYYYSLADFYLLTSRFESYGMPLIESFACGTPMVGYDRDDVRREHISNSGAGLLYNDKSSLLNAVDDVLKNHQTYSGRALKYAEKFNWKVVAQKYIQVYEALL